MEKSSSTPEDLRFRRGGGRSLPPPSSSSSATWRSRRSDRAEAPASSREVSDQSPSIREPDHTAGGHGAPCTPTLIGTCPDMCPAKERAQRERLRDLSIFERLKGNVGRTSPSLAVKKFCRTISTTHTQTSDVRPPAVLQSTLEYLLNLVDSSEHPFEVVHDFVFDRTRSIRQDLNMQNIINDQAIHMYEEMVKFHIISHQKLARCCSKSDISSLRYLNMEQLMKCLLSLFDIYDINRRTKPINKNEAEFYSFYVLLCLGCKIPTMGDSLSLWFRQLHFVILQSNEMRFARTILRYFRTGNYKCFFSTIAAEASHLQLCLIETLLNEVRARAISYVNFSGYKLHPYPLPHLAQVLMIKEPELESLCYECGLKIMTDEAGCKLLPAKQTTFCPPKTGFQSYGLLRPQKSESPPEQEQKHMGDCSFPIILQPKQTCLLGKPVLLMIRRTGNPVDCHQPPPPGAKLVDRR